MPVWLIPSVRELTRKLGAARPWGCSERANEHVGDLPWSGTGRIAWPGAVVGIRQHVLTIKAPSANVDGMDLSEHLPDPSDVAQALACVVALRRLADDYEASVVRIALQEGWSWSQIGEALAAAQNKYHIHQRRVYLGGFDCGGSMAFRLAMLHPETFAGVLSLGGPFPGGNCLRRLSDVRQMPLFIASGATSERYPADRVCDDLRLLHSAGMNITLRHYPCGHVVTPDMLSDMNRWIMELVTGPPRAPLAASDYN